MFMSPVHVFFPCHLQRMMLPIKERLPLWACNLMQIGATDCQTSAVVWRRCYRASVAGNTAKLHTCDCHHKDSVKLMSPSLILGPLYAAS